MRCKKAILVFIFIYGFVLQCFSQKLSKEDSLKALLIEANISEKAKICHQLTKLYRLKDTVQQLFYARKTLKYAKQISNQKYSGIGTSEIGRYYSERGNYDSANYYFHKALPYFKSNKTLAITFSLLSGTESKKGNFEKAIKFLIRSDSLFNLDNNKRGMISSKINLSSILTGKGDYKESIEYLYEAEKLVSNENKVMGKIYHNLSNNFFYLGDTINAIKYTLKSIAIREKINDSLGLAYSYSNYGKLSTEIIPFEERVLYFKKASSIFQKVGSKSNLINIYINLGNAYRENDNLDKAESYLLKAQSISQNSKAYIANRSLFKELYLLYDDQKKWKKAYNTVINYNELKDSIINIENNKTIKELQTKYETEKIIKEKKLAEVKMILAQSQNQSNKNFGIAMALLGCVFLLGGFIAYYKLKTKKKQEILSLKLKESKNKLYLEQQARLSELKALQSQMNPHFVYNSLNSIQDLILMKDIRNSNKYLGKFSDFIRKVLVFSSKTSISISEEIELLTLYTELEQLRFGNQLKVSIENKLSEYDSDEFKIPTMFIQPYVENALKHGLLHKNGDKKLSILFKKEHLHIVCCIEDNGVGRRKANAIRTRRNPKHQGFSTKANQERVNLLNINKKQKINIEIIDKVNNNESTGTKVILLFPLIA